MANGEQKQVGSMVPNIFTEKTVGISFAAAFGLWAWYLNGLATTVMDGVGQIREDSRMMGAEISQVQAELVSTKLQLTQQIVQIQERQAVVMKHLDQLENDMREIQRRRSAEAAK